MVHDGIGFRCADVLQRDRDLDSSGQDVVARIAQHVVINDVDGGHTEGGDPCRSAPRGPARGVGRAAAQQRVRKVFHVGCRDQRRFGFSDLGRDLDQFGAPVFLAVFVDGADRDSAHARGEVAGQGGGPDVGRVARRRPIDRAVLDA